MTKNGPSPSKADENTNEDGPPPSSISQAFVFGSISSSCCVIQLILNTFSYLGIMNGFGCAGFNTILGPLRPVTRLMTLVWLMWNWNCARPRSSVCCTDNGNGTSSIRERKPRRPIPETCLCLALMFSPEMVTLYGNYTNGDLPSIYWLHQKWDTTGHLVRVNYVVDNMGCEACINAVERLIRGQDGVMRGTVTSFETGEVEIYIQNAEGKSWDDEKKKMFEEGLDNELQIHGYELHELGWVTKKMNMNMNMQANEKMFSIGGAGDL